MSSSGSGSIPATLGRYRVLRRLGAGGMAEVFLARSSGAEGIEKTLVVKRVLPSIAKRPRFIAMFVDEAKLATRLNHPNIVQVYNFEQVRGEFLLAMEYVDGEDLSRLLVRGRENGIAMPPQLAAWIVAEAAKGLDYAHRRTDERDQPMDIVHRDVSPQNILISYEGVVKIADFGIARARSLDPQAGVIQGKFAYMSPEQARGSTVDRRSDVYGLGTVLTELLAGRPLFDRGARVLDAVRKGRVPKPRDLDPEVPEVLDAVARRAMATEPEERFESARDMLRALTQYLHEQREPVDPTTLEAWLERVVPVEQRRAEEAGGGSGLPPAPGVAGSGAAIALHEARERRPVLVLVGHLWRSGVAGDPGIADVAVRILDDIAFKADAVFGWAEDTEDLDRRTFRMVLGLGESGVSEPLRAVRLALDVIDALGSLSDGDARLLAGGLGLSRGVASLQRDPQGRLLRYQPEDDAFALAAALSRGSEEAEVLVAGEVYRLARREFAFDEEAVREVALMIGEEDVTPQAVRAFPLLGARAYDQRVAQGRLSAHAPLIGREALVARLERSVLEALRDGAQRALRVTGPLGVGKTSVVLAALDRVGSSARCLHVECGYGSARDSLSALRQLLHLALGFEPGRTPTKVVEAARVVLGQGDPDGTLAGRAARLLEGGWLPSEDPDLSRTAGTVTELLRALAAEHPLLVCVDALQWADEASMRVLAMLATRAHRVPLVFWLCGRPEPAIDRCMQGVRNHPVEELSPSDARKLLAHCLEVDDVPHALVRAVLSRAGGNPLFIVEIAEAMRERGDVWLETDTEGARTLSHVRDPGALPAALEDVVSARLLQLSPASLATLRWLSVVGARIDDAELAELMGVPDPEAIDDLRVRGILHRDARGRLAFANPVLRQVALDGLDLRDRASMQRRVEVELLAARPYLRAVVHARELEDQGVGREAARAFAAAAVQARQAGELPDALRYLARALTLLPVADGERVDLHRARASLLRTLGRERALSEEIATLREQAETTGEPRARGWAFALSAEQALSRGDAEQAEGQLGVARAVESATRDASLAALVGQLEAQLAWQRGDRAPLEASIARLSAGGSESVEPDVLGRVYLLECALGEHDRDWPRLRQAALSALSAATRAGDPGTQGRAAEALALAVQVDGALEDALWLLRGGQAGARDAGVAAGTARRLWAIGSLHADLGDAPSARAHLERAGDLAARCDDAQLAAEAALELLRLELYVVGDVARAETALGRMLGLSGADPALVSLARGHLAAHAGHWPVAESALREALEVDPGLASPLLYAELSLARGAAGDREGERAAALEAFGLLTERPCPRGLERAHVRVREALGHAGLFELRERIGVRGEERLSLCAGQLRDEQMRQTYLASWREGLAREVRV